MLPLRGYALRGDGKYKRSNLCESSDTTAEQLSSYTKEQEFKSSGHNLLHFLGYCDVFGTSFDYIFPPFISTLCGQIPFIIFLNYWESSESQHFLEVSHFRISFEVTGGKNYANTFS